MAFPLFLTCFSLLPLVLSAPSKYTPNDPNTQLLGKAAGVPGIDKTFDYLIVGGGTAGLTVAARLAENPNLAVAVIEAGGFYEIENGNTSVVPGYDVTYAYPRAGVTPPVDWGLTTEPQAGYDGRRIYYPQGKTLGGSSALNFMAYHRATVGTFDWWAQLVGDQSYVWDRIFPFYKKSAQFTPPNLEKIGPGFDIPYDLNAFSRQGGPLHISFANYQQPVGPYLAKGMTAVGIKAQQGLNSGTLMGHAPTTVEVDPKDEIRSSSEESFLQSAIRNTSIRVYHHTMAKRILFNRNKKATGVIVETDGKTYTLSAHKEIIVSAGAFHSPQLLMVSGIGPGATLKEHNIPAVSTLEGVGQNLWDQVYFAVIHKVNVTTNSQLLSNPSFAAAAAETYRHNQTGPLASVSGDVFGWEKVPEPNRGCLSATTLSQLSKFPSDWPEIEYVPIDIVTPPANTLPTDNFIAFGVALLTPISRGNVTIKSADTDDKPLLNPNWLFETADQEVAVQAVRRVREIAVASGVVIEEVAPGPAVQSDAQILKWLQDNASLIYHASATCAMGKASDSHAVIDSRARVFGVKDLRVVDASAFPFLPPGHPSGAIYMLAEKIADDILTR